MKLCKQHWLVDDAWFCDCITVQGPEACAEAAFPCYGWVQGDGVLSLPEGTGEWQRGGGHAGRGGGGIPKCKAGRRGSEFLKCDPGQGRPRVGADTQPPGSRVCDLKISPS